MKTQSNVQLDTYQVMGRKLRINFNEQIVELADDEGEVFQAYSYDTACCDKLASRDKIIEAIMATKYPTFGSEIAAIKNEEVAHEELRVLAKNLADGWLSIR